MALDRLDAVIIGANVEGLFAAVELARAGCHIVVLERSLSDHAAGEGRDAVVSVAAMRELHLAQHGLRLASAPVIVGVTSTSALILWPEMQAAHASIAAQSPRDADAYEIFCARMTRALRSKPANPVPLTSWLLAASPADELQIEQIHFRSAPLAGYLDELFDNELLKGMLAQGALIGTAVSPQAPGSATLLSRRTCFSADTQSRFVAGGEAELRRALLASLKYYNNADVYFGHEASEIALEREAVHSVRLKDGTTFRASTVISALGRERTLELLAGGRRPSEGNIPSQGTVEPAQVKFTTTAVPKLPGIDAATVAAGAIVRLNPNIDRLTKSHGAFRSQQLASEPCLEFRVIPKQAGDGTQRWEVFASVLFVPAETAEGSWSGNRRDRLVAHCMKTIDALVPGFGASVEAAALSHPKETLSVLDTESRAQAAAYAQPDTTAVPEALPSTALSILKGLLAIDTSLFAPVGEGGLLAAQSAGLSKRAKGQNDA